MTCILRNQKVHYHIHTSTPLVPILSQTHLFHTFPPYFPKIYYVTSASHLRLGLPSGLVPSGFRAEILYAFLITPTRATYLANLIFLDIIILIMFSEAYK